MVKCSVYYCSDEIISTQLKEIRTKLNLMAHQLGVSLYDKLFQSKELFSARFTNDVVNTTVYYY